MKSPGRTGNDRGTRRPHTIRPSDDPTVAPIILRLALDVTAVILLPSGHIVTPDETSHLNFEAWRKRFGKFGRSANSLRLKEIRSWHSMSDTDEPKSDFSRDLPDVANSPHSKPRGFNTLADLISAIVDYERAKRHALDRLHLPWRK